jgi:hypothetical protein
VRPIARRGVKPDAVRRAVELSARRYCAVGAMLAPSTALEERYRVIDAATGAEVTGRLRAVVVPPVGLSVTSTPAGRDLRRPYGRTVAQMALTFRPKVFGSALKSTKKAFQPALSGVGPDCRSTDDPTVMLPSTSTPPPRTLFPAGQAAWTVRVLLVLNCWTATTS